LVNLHKDWVVITKGIAWLGSIRVTVNSCYDARVVTIDVNRPGVRNV